MTHHVIHFPILLDEAEYPEGNRPRPILDHVAAAVVDRLPVQGIAT